MTRKSRINKQRTSTLEAEARGAFDIAGNVRRKGQDPSPNDRVRGERSDAESAGPVDIVRR